MQHFGSSNRRQRGVTLIESLVAFAVVSLGTVSVIRLQRDLHFNADLSGQRAEASHIGQGAVERQRAAAGVQAAPTGPSTSTMSSRNTLFRTDSETNPLGVLAPDATGIATTVAADSANVSVSWSDATGGPRDVSIDTMVARVTPTLSAALAVRTIDSTVARIAGRAAAIPVDAKNLGNGQSAWKGGAGDRVVWLFDNATGRIVSRCTGSASLMSTTDITLANLDQCATSRATLLSGLVRTSLAAPPNGSIANDRPDPLAVVLTLTVPVQADRPTCTTEPQRSVEAVFGSGAAAVLRRQAVPIDATPASIGATRWTDLGDRFVAYRCLVVDPPGGWTGRTTIEPLSVPLQTAPGTPAAPNSATAATAASAIAASAIATASTAAAANTAAAAWTIGETRLDRKVCRFVTIPNGGSVGRNAAHPAEYVAVTESLTQQNFLIVRGDQHCPGVSFGNAVTTEQQQP